MTNQVLEEVNIFTEQRQAQENNYINNHQVIEEGRRCEKKGRNKEKEY